MAGNEKSDDLLVWKLTGTNRVTHALVMTVSHCVPVHMSSKVDRHLRRFALNLT